MNIKEVEILLKEVYFLDECQKENIVLNYFQKNQSIIYIILEFEKTLNLKQLYLQLSSKGFLSKKINNMVITFLTR